MCNPNSNTLVYRRQRALALAANVKAEGKTSNPFVASPSGSLGSSLRRPVTQPESLPCDFLPPLDTSVSSSCLVPQDVSKNYTIATGLLSSTQYVSEMIPPKKPKRRRRRPQLPGKTAKQNERHFVIHNYHDHAQDKDTLDERQDDHEPSRRRGGVALSFPQKLHRVLDQVEQDGLGHVLSWQPHGRCFVIHQPKVFAEHVMPHYFKQTKLTSFQRQLNLYGFNRITRGDDAGGYYHELFLRGKVFLCKRMVRTKIKGTKFKAASSPDQEPNFYAMPPVIVTPTVSDSSENSEECDLHGSAGDNLEPWILEPLPQNKIPVGNPERYFCPPQELPVCQPPPTSPQQQPMMVPARFPEISPVAVRDQRPRSFDTTCSGAGYLQPIPLIQSFDLEESVPRESTIPIGTSWNPKAAVVPQQVVSGDSILDETVEELFLSGALGRSVDSMEEPVTDFVNIWDPSSYGEDAALENDIQLGNLLDKVMMETEF